MPTLHAQPYDTSATGFYFTSEEDFTSKFEAKLPVEEYEIQFIDGTDDELTLYNIAEPCQSTIARYYDLVDACLSDNQITALSYLVDNRGFTLEDGLDKMDEVDLFHGTATEYAIEHMNDCYDMDTFVAQYFNYEALANDLECEGDLVEIDTRVFVTNGNEF